MVTETADTPAPAPPGDAAAPPATDVVRYLAAGALVGAAAIHFAYAPAHFDHETTHGAFFVAAGWLQLVAGIAMARAARPPKLLLGVIALVNAGLVGVWVLSRTAGVPGNPAEDVGFPDVLATSLEVVVVLLTVALALGLVSARPIGRVAGFGVAGVGAVATIALVSLSVTPSIAGEHEHGAGADGGHGHDEAAGAGHGHDGAEAAAGADDWNATREATLTGYLPDEEIARLTQVNREYLTARILERSRTLGDLPEAERTETVDTFVDWVLANALEGENGAHGADGAEGGGHSHGPTAWVPIEDPADQLALQEQLDTAGQVMPRFPTAAQATAGGYFQVTPWVPGIGAHYINPGLIDGTFDPARPEMLLYNGNEPTSELVGLSYATIGVEPVDGFVGENDSWHNHPSLCTVGGFVVGPDHTPDEMCDSIGGRKNEMPEGGPTLWMAHLWQVPGWESHWGLFSGESPAINMATTDIGRTTG